MNDAGLAELKIKLSDLYTEDKKDYDFHDLITYMAQSLGFEKTGNWYSGYLKDGDTLKRKDYEHREQLLLVAQDLAFSKIQWERQLKRGDDWLRTFTEYTNAELFFNNHYASGLLFSSSTLSLEDEVEIASFDELEKEDPATLNMYVEAKQIIRYNKFFIISPNLLYRAVVKKNKHENAEPLRIF